MLRCLLPCALPRTLFLSLAAALVAGCGERPAAEGVPAWARVSSEQIAEAARVGMPVAFENAIGMRFVLIPAGTFAMGSPPEEDGHDRTETLHDVTLTRPWYLQTTEVTNAQFRRFRPEHASGATIDGQTLDLDAQPVVNVSWDDATAFVAWLRVRDPGRAYRLPTEAEWERACRAGTSTAFWWGPSISADRANYAPWPEPGVPLPVGTLPPSPWGLHDMHGNASEWCADRYDDRDHPPGPATDPTGPEEGDSRVRRGGAYAGEVPQMLRAAFRIGVADGDARSYVGFRVAVSVPAT